MSYDRVVVVVSGVDRAETLALLERARRRGFTRFALGHDAEPPPSGSGELWQFTPDELTALSGPRVPRSIHIFTVSSPTELDQAIASGSANAEPLAVRWVGERVLPLESLVARAQGRFDVWVVTDHVEEVRSALGSLERGADAVVIAIHSVAELDALERLLDRAIPNAFVLVATPVRRVAAGGVGDRVIVDTTSLLAPDEGLVVGSAAAFLYLVLSEAVGSRYTRPRPFRVNAGAAHSYTLLADGSTRYLSELEPGDTVAVIRVDGSARPVRVGRLKIERRPLILVQGAMDGANPTVFVQEAETVRLQSTRGPVASTAVTTDDELLGVRLPPARHLGTVVEETIHER